MQVRLAVAGATASAGFLDWVVKQLDIAIAGTGYTGLNNAIPRAQHNEAVAIYISPTKLQVCNDKQSPTDDHETAAYLKNKPLNLHATPNKQLACPGAVRA